MHTELILIIIILFLLFLLLVNIARFRNIKNSLLKEIDIYEERISEEESKRIEAEAEKESYIHLKQDLHNDIYPSKEIKIKNNTDLYNNITQPVYNENQKLLKRINRNILFITKGGNIFNNEVNDESEILLSLSSLNIDYQSFYIGKSNPKLDKIMTLLIHYKENYFIIYNHLESLAKEENVKEIKKLLTLWSSNKYTENIANILAKKNFMKPTDIPNIIAVTSELTIEKLKKIDPNIVKEFHKKEIYLTDINNLSQFIAAEGEQNNNIS
jgi:hypothetical protein